MWGCVHPRVRVSLTSSVCLWACECLRVFARLSPGLVCICVYVFPHIRVWICVQVLLCVICVITPSCLCTRLWSGPAILPCVCICVSEQVEMGAPVLCHDPMATVCGLDDGNRNLCGCDSGPGPSESTLEVERPGNLSPSAPAWTQAWGLSLAPCPDPVPTSYSLFLFCLLCPTSVSCAWPFFPTFPNPLILASKPTCISS